MIAPNSDRDGSTHVVERAPDSERAKSVKVSRFSSFIIGETTLSIRCAELLLARGHHLHGVVSDNPEIVRWGAEAEIPVLDPSGDFGSVLLATPYDHLFSIVNERILPPAVTASPRGLTINFHDAPLPRYAGMHATSWALMNHERTHGISWHVASAVVDAGDIVTQRSVPIEPGDTALSLNAKCYEAAADAFVDVIEALEHGNPVLQPQDLTRRTYFGRHRRPASVAVLDWRSPVADLSALVRALDFGPYVNPLGRPKILLDGAALACRVLMPAVNTSRAAPGTVVGLGDDWLAVAAADGDAVLRGIGPLTGGQLAPGALERELGLRVGMTLPLLSDEMRERASAADIDAAKAEGHWVERLANARPVSSPFARDLPVSGEHRWHTVDVTAPTGFANAESGGPHDLAARFVAAVTIYLSRISRERELDVGLRLPEVGATGLDRLFATVVPLRLRADTSRSFNEIVAGVATELDRARQLGAYARDVLSRYPVLRDRGRAPRFPVQIQLSGTPDRSARDDSDLADLHVTVNVDRATCTLSCRASAIATDRAARIATHLETLLAGLATSPGAPAVRLPLVPDDERRRLLVDWNETSAPYPRHLTVHALVEAQVARTPNAVAMTDGTTSLTYRELDALAEAVATRLRASGVGRGGLVGIFAGRSAALVVAILGVLKAGAAYVPLDAEYPAERLRFVIDDASLAAFVIEEGIGGCPTPPHAYTVVLDALGNVRHEIGRSPAAPESPGPAGPEDLAYVIYTSGSTGHPKGAMIAHRGVVNYLTWAAAAYEASAGRGAPLHSSPAFDLTVTALFTPLVSGTAVHLVDQALGVDALATALRDRPGFSLVKITPAHLTLLSRQLTPAEAAVATNAFVIGGENLIGEALEFWRRQSPSTALINEYGPTETVVGCCVYRVAERDRFPGSVPIGRPIANTRLYVLDDNHEPLPEGIAGELYVGGDGVGLGYLNRPELTAERFLPDPFVQEPGARMYRTGDLVRYRPDGNLEFLGRLDDQVKIRGFRIELGEVETVLAALPSVQSAAVVAHEYAPGDRRLVGYYVPERGAGVDPASLREQLRRVLPDYMVPAVLMRMDTLPLTENGKVDRKALPRPEATKSRRPLDSAAPRGEAEHAIAAIWEEALGAENISRTDDFFDLGGHSLLVQRVRLMIEQRLGHALSTADMFRNPTIAGLGALIAARSVPPPPGERTELASPPAAKGMSIPKLVRRFLVPGFVNALYFFLRYRAQVSPRAEVEISPLLVFGTRCVVGSFTKIKATDGPVHFGNECGIATSCFITAGAGGLHIGDNFGCGPSVSIVASSFVWDRIGVAPSKQGLISSGIRIGNNVWLGANVTVLDGAEIGDDTIVVAGSVVDGKHPPGVVLRGNPAKVVARR